jgi:hypothetical protein
MWWYQPNLGKYIPLNPLNPEGTLTNYNVSAKVAKQTGAAMRAILLKRGFGVTDLDDNNNIVRRFKDFDFDNAGRRLVRFSDSWCDTASREVFHSADDTKGIIPRTGMMFMTSKSPFINSGKFPMPLDYKKQPTMASPFVRLTDIDKYGDTLKFFDFLADNVLCYKEGAEYQTACILRAVNNSKRCFSPLELDAREGSLGVTDIMGFIGRLLMTQTALYTPPYELRCDLWRLLSAKIVWCPVPKDYSALYIKEVLTELSDIMPYHHTAVFLTEREYETPLTEFRILKSPKLCTAYSWAAKEWLISAMITYLQNGTSV